MRVAVALYIFQNWNKKTLTGKLVGKYRRGSKVNAVKPNKRDVGITSVSRRYCDSAKIDVNVRLTGLSRMRPGVMCSEPQRI